MNVCEIGKDFLYLHPSRSLSRFFYDLHLNLNLASLASSYAKFMFTQVVQFDANGMFGDRAA